MLNDFDDVAVLDSPVDTTLTQRARGELQQLLGTIQIVRRIMILWSDEDTPVQYDRPEGVRVQVVTDRMDLCIYSSHGWIETIWEVSPIGHAAFARCVAAWCDGLAYHPDGRIDRGDVDSPDIVAYTLESLLNTEESL